LVFKDGKARLQWDFATIAKELTVQGQSCPTHGTTKQQEGFLLFFGLLILFCCDFELGLYVTKRLRRCKFHIGISTLVSK
jgi:hypothetical protein